MAESNELIQKYFNIDRDSTPLDEQKKGNELAEERSSEINNLENIINPDNFFISAKLKK